jgi:hypothetical protein
MMPSTWPRGATAAATVALAACSPAEKAGSGADVDFEFECGELDLYDLMALVLEDRLYEVACGEMPEGYPSPELSWEELAASYRALGVDACTSDPGLHGIWSGMQRGCGKEAAVNLSIHAYRAASCPTYEWVDGRARSSMYEVGMTSMLRELRWVVEDACFPYVDPD